MLKLVLLLVNNCYRQGPLINVQNMDEMLETENICVASKYLLQIVNYHSGF
jgi:hypothetical protein